MTVVALVDPLRPRPRPRRAYPATLLPAAVVRIEPYARAVYIGQTELDLTRREYDLLLFLAEHPRQVFTRVQLLENVWGHVHAGERTVDVHVRRLRAKLGDDLVKTVRGIGYRLHDSTHIHVSNGFA